MRVRSSLNPNAELAQIFIASQLKQKLPPLFCVFRLNEVLAADTQLASWVQAALPLPLPLFGNTSVCR